MPEFYRRGVRYVSGARLCADAMRRETLDVENRRQPVLIEAVAVDAVQSRLDCGVHHVI